MPIEKLKLKKTKNMRDMGGIPTADGKKIKFGKLIRSGRLYNLPVETVDALVAMKVGTIIDMRTSREINSHIPTIIDGAEYHYLTLAATPPPELSSSKHMSIEFYAQSKRVKKDFGSNENYMHAMYECIAFDPDSVQKLRTVFDLLLKEENCTIFHCNSGTDRTGIVAMLIESLLGVEKETILEDYMASKIIQKRRRNAQKFAMKLIPGFYRMKRLLYVQMEPRPQYMLELMKKMENRYGSVTGYVKEALGLTDEQIETLKLKYLE